MRAGWFPATTNRPATAFTFTLLSFLHELNLQSKANIYDFFRTLQRITDNTGVKTVKNRYKQLTHVMRLWRHLKMLKRAGRGHAAAGIDATAPGELVIECPACPHPGKNLPDNWENSPPHVRWLYALFLMIDANFRAQLKDRSLEDAELGSGWSYYVEETRYMSHVAKYGDQKEESTCSAEHKAILHANLRKEGYLASGVGAVLCARHALVRKNGVGDLQKGERYCNIDYLVASTLLGVILAILFSYDIACQWFRNFFKRMQEFPDDLRFEPKDAVRFAIPKKHFRVHGPNHSQFSLNYLPKVGRTYGEGIESAWAHMNPVSLSTREMTPGGRHEVLNDHWGGWNWQKTIAFAPSLFRSLREARKMHRMQRQSFEEFSSTFPPETLKKWKDMLDAWNADFSKPSPYEEMKSTATMNTVRLELANEEALEAERGILPRTM
ncbi:hypothetical protein A0H81_06621 [Grifola frondosa]|uniref:CxC2-like cysteine cluster KDZ transposase-associated domain-containing protein n=1 Tax=Grifola frondosa TaxID=5627 RepID=A0A1C7M980_GRIFR|nr:hypothetical protein A0H81_06621 [Grifola frondosa]